MKKDFYKSTDDHRYQKDWIICDFQKNNLFCLAIASIDNINWYLLEFVNYFDLSNEEMQEMVSLGYQTMLDSSDSYKYQYEIGQHSFSKQKFDKIDYWEKLLNNHKYGKTSYDPYEVIVVKPQLEKEVESLMPSPDFSGGEILFKSMKKKYPNNLKQATNILYKTFFKSEIMTQNQWDMKIKGVKEKLKIAIEEDNNIAINALRNWLTQYDK